MAVLRFEPFRDPFDRLMSLAATGTPAPLGMPIDIYRSDDGTYHVSGSTLTISNADVAGSFRFRIQGKTLMLTPLLTPALKHEALADPLNFHTAGWMVAVAYSGHSWRHVACGWC